MLIYGTTLVHYYSAKMWDWACVCVCVCACVHACIQTSVILPVHRTEHGFVQTHQKIMMYPNSTHPSLQEVKMLRSCLLASLGKNLEVFCPELGESGRCNHFPTPVHNVINTLYVMSVCTGVGKCQCTPPLWQLHSDYGDCISGVCHVMKIAIAQKVILMDSL